MTASPAFTPSTFLGPKIASDRHAPSTPLMRTSQPTMSASPVNRRAFLAATIAAVASLAPGSALAARSTMSGDYKADATQVLGDMRAACDLSRGAAGMAETVGKTRKEMNDFVALYRRNDKVAGSSSFSTLYTAINTLSGHYASYGSNYPVPEKRKKRLSQQFAEIDRALNRNR